MVPYYKICYMKRYTRPTWFTWYGIFENKWMRVEVELNGEAECFSALSYA